jgi:protease-4
MTSCRSPAASPVRWVRWPSLLLFLLAFLACEGRPPTPRGQESEAASEHEDHLAELDLRSGAAEIPGASLLGGGRRDSHADLVELLRTIPRQERVKGVFVRLGVIQYGLSRADEVGRLLAEVRKERPVVCHADGLGTGSLLLAARGCSEIWLSPAGSLDTYGIAAQLIFGRELLDRLDVQVDFIQVGRYKGAEEPFTRNSASPEARRSLQHALRGVRSAWVTGVTEGRDEEVDPEALEDGPHHAEAAKALGAIDEIGFEEDARQRAYELTGVEGKVEYFGRRRSPEGGIASLVRLLSGTEATRLPHVAIVRAQGAITLSGGGGIFGDGGIAERDLTKTLAELRDDPSVKAVVLRIDSPGGSALASDLLWRRLMDLRREKPLVVSVGGMAASGGYYMACAGSKVVVEASSIIGSIGVVAGKLSVQRTLDEQGVHVETVPARPGHGKRPLLRSPLDSWDDATRAKLRQGIEHAYDLFVARIAEGRGLEADAIQPHAEGRLMSGADAVQAGLADEVGGLTRAIDLAAELASLQSEDEVPIRILRDDGGLLGLLGLDAAARAEAAERLEREAATRAAQVLTAKLLPYRAELTTFAASAAPLLSGERVVAALPFVIAIR